jgi:hypothetical protein
MCGASLLNTDAADIPTIASVAVVLVLLLLTFQCPVTLGSSMCTETVLETIIKPAYEQVRKSISKLSMSYT